MSPGFGPILKSTDLLPLNQKVEGGANTEPRITPHETSLLPERHLETLVRILRSDR